MKSYEFLKPTLAIVLALLLSVRPAQSGIGPAANITNLSTRAFVSGDPLDLPNSFAIAGFTITGTDPKQVVIRGLGPTLTNFNLTPGFGDPKVGLYDVSGTLIFSNNNWKDTQQAAIEATGLAPPFDVESAILITLPPGKYTAILSAEGFAFGGFALVEVYDINPGVLAELTNISARGLVQNFTYGLICGFIASGGNGSTTVLLRGLGPTLSEFGIGGRGFGPLPDPVLTLVDGNGNVLQSNNNWKDAQQAAIQATGLAPPNELEAAILATVVAGNYTVILSGNAGSAGIGLVEIYKL